MMNKKTDLGFMLTALSEVAWKELSSELFWTEQLLEKYSNQVDWKEVSSNTYMLWTGSMLEKFMSKIDWKELSASQNYTLLTVDNLSKYLDNWDWNELSDMVPSLDVLDKFADRWNWSIIIDCYSLSDHFNMDFLNKYIDYIPLNTLQKSKLWYYLKEEECAKIKQLILS